MDEAFDPFANSSNGSESETIDKGDNIYYDGEDEEVTVTDDGSYDEVTVTLHGEDSNNNNSDTTSNCMSPQEVSNGGYNSHDEVDENYSAEQFFEEVVHNDGNSSSSNNNIAPLPSIDNVASDNEIFSFGYLSIGDDGNHIAERSMKYDADADVASQQESSANSCPSTINDERNRKQQNSSIALSTRSKIIEESSLGVNSDRLSSSTSSVPMSESFHSSSLRSKEFSRSGDYDHDGEKLTRLVTTTVSDKSVSSIGQSFMMKSVREAALSSRSSSRVSLKGERSDRSESSTMVSREIHLNNMQPVRTREISSRKNSQRTIPDHSLSIHSGRNSAERPYESRSSKASRSIDSRAYNQSYRSQQRKQDDGIPVSLDRGTKRDIYFESNGETCASIAVLGTMSSTGKSVIAMALCRILTNGGTKCAPFKSQNTGINTSSALLPDPSRRDILYDSFFAKVEEGIGNKSGKNANISSLSIAPTKKQGYGQIGIAQSMQAEACKIVPRVQMNPIFFKSGGRSKKNESMCTMIVMGKQILRETCNDISRRIPAIQKMALDCHSSLSAVTGAEVIVVQGAGSCSELNLMDGDIVNLPLVRHLQCPWLLVANDEKGGVFAQVIGTKMCVSKRDWDLCAGIIVNKVKHEVNDFLLGLKMLEQMTKKPLYAMPFIEDLAYPNEDTIDTERRLAWERSHYGKSIEGKEGKPSVVVVAYPHAAISNDLYPLEKDCRFLLEWRRKRLPKPYPITTAVILPDSTHTLLDLKWLQDSGWAEFLRKHVSAGGTVLGLGGGYQMLGWEIKEGPDKRQGIGLLPISSRAKAAECNLIEPLKGQLYPSGTRVEGFEVDCGTTEVVLSERKNVADGRYKGIAPLIAYENGKPEGMRHGRVQGTCLHGLFRSSKARVELLVPIQERKKFPSILAGNTPVDPLDKFASLLETRGLDYITLRKMIFHSRNKMQ